MKVYQAINAVQAALAEQGISKDRRNQQQGYAFRGIDDVYNALAPLLAQHKLCILPRCLRRECVERESRNGGVLFYVTVEVEFDFVSAEDGTTAIVRTFGEAMDSGDKATNKAMSAAYKYACMQAFSIPTEGDNDADSTTHEVRPAAPPAAKRGRPAATVATPAPAPADPPPASGALPKATVDDYVAAIANAAHDELAEVAKAGLLAASKARDKPAYDRILAARDARRAELEHAS